MTGVTEYTTTRWLYLRCLGLVCLVAIVSFWYQAEGLFGSVGLMPVGDHMVDIVRYADRQGWSSSRFWEFPTLFWLGTSDLMLHLLCGLGTFSAALLVFNIFPAPALFCFWGVYLSLCVGGRVFLSFQWDMLLLETCLVSMLLVPWGLRPGRAVGSPISPAAVFLGRFLLFKLMFLSGMVKILSEDPPWLNLTALELHYWTQPIPHLGAYLTSQLPHAFHILCCGVLLIVEIGLPFLFFGPRRWRLFAGIAQIALQIVIMATGNFGFFNYITIALCLLLFDDRFLHACFARLVPDSMGQPRELSTWRAVTTVVAVVVAMVANISVMGAQLGYERFVPGFAGDTRSALRSLRSINGYGLFADMTETRPEVIMEVSDDGVVWLPIEFHHKPGRLDEMPGWLMGYMPRLDWQMWFAALRGNCQRVGWYLSLMQRLLESSPSVLSLLPAEALPNGAPRYIRSRLFHYWFRDPQRAEVDENLWSRELVGEFCPPVMLSSGRLVRADL